VPATLFMHYAFDTWLEREFPLVKSERCAGGAVIHCASGRQARTVLAAVQERMAQAGLELHPDKTTIVYCKDSSRRGRAEHTSFTFSGVTFRPRQARRKDGVQVTSFPPAISKDALKEISAEVRSWRLHRHIEMTTAGIACWINPKVRGRMTCYGTFYRSALYPVLHRISTYLPRWIMNKYKRLRTWKKAARAMASAAATRPRHLTRWARAKPASP
jgi:hypothetical protein